jgi:hypothetical protein
MIEFLKGDEGFLTRLKRRAAHGRQNKRHGSQNRA